MSKTTVTRLFFGSLLAIVGGFILMLVAGVLGRVNGAYVMNGPDVVGVESSGLGLTMVVIAVIAVVAMAAGALGQFVAWIGAMLNTAQLQDKTWFLLLLILGLFSFGFIAMLVYVVAGPDGTSTPSQPKMRAPSTPARGAA